MNLGIKIDSRDLQKYLNQIAKQNMNAKPLMVWMHSTVRMEIIKNFRRQGATADILSGHPADNNRTSWKPLSEYTKKRRAASKKSRGPIGTILQDSGNLFGSIGRVSEITRNSMMIGTNTKYAAPNHFGATIRPKRAKYLTLPFPGVEGRARQYSDTFVRGKVIYQNQGGKIVPLFALKLQVDIPARPFMTVPKSTIDDLATAAGSFAIGAWRVSAPTFGGF